MTSNNFFYSMVSCTFGFLILSLTFILTERTAIDIAIVGITGFFVGSLYFILKDYETEYAKIS